VSLHAKEREMFEHPTHAGGVAFGIAGSSDGVEGEANAEKAPDWPVRDAVAAEIEEEPGGDHHYCGNGSRFRVGGGSRQNESGAGGKDSRDLQHVSDNDRKAAEDLSLRERT